MKYLKSVVIALAVSTGLAACQDFLEEKKNYQMTSPDLYNYYEGALGRVNDIYAQCLPNPNASDNWHYPSWGDNDNLAKATEEYSGFSSFVHPLNTLDSRTSGLTVPDYFVGDATNIQNNPWGLIRLINDAIEGIEGSSGLTQEQKEEFLGQLYFFRAWRYFMMWKWYGGVPKIDFLPDITPNSVTPRSTTKEILDFIINDLDTSAALLSKYTVNGKWSNATSDYGRITPSAALALKGRALVWWCSPLFNREGLESRYKEAYEIMKKDFDEVISTSHSLAQAKDATLSGWADMFQTIVNDEAVFFARLNDIADGDLGRQNPWEQTARPHNSKPKEGGGKNPSAMIVDMFPMRDGGVPDNSYFAGTKLKTSELAYDADHPFLNRDLRFYRTFGFPGIKWTFSGDPRNSDVLFPYSGSDYELWNYVWYEKADQRDSEISGSTYGPDALESHISGMYVTKKTSSGNAAGYSWDATNGFQYSFASLIEIRYAEVLLNMAEIACGAGFPSEAVNNYLLPVRERAGYAGKQGLAANAESDKAACMAAILYERQIELAYEGKRFDDLRRWLLFDGGANFSEIPGAPASWKLTGFGGNTCTWLGFKPLNGQRRENLEFRVNNDTENGLGKMTMPGKGEWDKLIEIDPIATSATKEFGWTDDASKADDLWIQFRNWRSGYVVDLNKCTSTAQLDEQLENLAKFYDKYLVRKLKRGDERQPTDNTNIEGMVVRYLPKYYFLGLTGTAQDRNPTLEQNIGWDGLGGNGTFDPLAE